MPIDACFNVDAYAKIDLCVKVVNQSKNPMFGSVVQCLLQKFYTFCSVIQLVIYKLYLQSIMIISYEKKSPPLTLCFLFFFSSVIVVDKRSRHLLISIL